jgi:hypothetical protein
VSTFKPIFTREDQAAAQLPFQYQVLYHLVDLIDGQWGTMADLVLEGHLLFSMAGAFGVSVPRGMEVDQALNAVDPAVRLQLREIIEYLEREHLVTVNRGDDPSRGWRMTPTGTGHMLIYKWHGHRMNYLEHIAAQPRGLRRWLSDIVAPPQAAPILTGIITLIGGFLLGHFTSH